MKRCGPLRCLDLSQIFFGSSPTVMEWDKIVAEIIDTLFVFFGHPSPTGPLEIFAPAGGLLASLTKVLTPFTFLVITNKDERYYRCRTKEGFKFLPSD